MKKIAFIPGRKAGIKEDPNKAGIIEIRPGTNGIDLGSRGYEMAYLRVIDESHYFKGMCLYANDLPNGYDVVLYYGDPHHGLDALKTITPDIKLDNGILTKAAADEFVTGNIEWNDFFDKRNLRSGFIFKNKTPLETEPIFGIHIEFADGSKPIDYYNLNLKQTTVALQDWSEDWVLIPEKDCQLNGEVWKWHANARKRRKRTEKEEEEESFEYPELGIPSMFTEPAE